MTQVAPAPEEKVRPGEVLPWIGGSALVGAASLVSPLAAAAAAGSAALAALPWMVLFALGVLAATVQSASVDVLGMTFRPEMLLASILALRAFTMRRRRDLGSSEWFLLAFLALMVVSSLLQAADLGASLRGAAMMSFGALAYLAVVVAFSTPERLFVGVRIFLVSLGAGAAVGIAALASHYAFGTQFGITLLDTLDLFPSVKGVAYEHDLYGSTCAVGVVVFFVLWRERSRILTDGWLLVGGWLCAAGCALALARGAWVALAIAGIVALWTSRPRRSIAPLVAGGLAAVVVGALLLGLFTSFDVGEKAGTTAGALHVQSSRALSFGSTTGAQRVAEWKLAYADISASPLLGSGAISYGQHHLIKTQYGSKPAFLGNWLVRIVYDTGLVGLGLFLAFALPIVWPSDSVVGASGESAVVARALVCGCIVIAVAYLATDALLLVWPWILLGLTRSARLLVSQS